jgi:hypothetical protein
LRWDADRTEDRKIVAGGNLGKNNLNRSGVTESSILLGNIKKASKKTPFSFVK